MQHPQSLLVCSQAFSTEPEALTSPGQDPPLPQKYKSNKKIIELLRLEKTSEIIKSSHQMLVCSSSRAGRARWCPLIFPGAFGRGVRGSAGNKTTSAGFCVRQGELGGAGSATANLEAERSFLEGTLLLLEKMVWNFHLKNIKQLAHIQ